MFIIYTCHISFFRERKKKEERKKNMSNMSQWRWLWHLHIPQRCKIFLWLALNERLPTSVPHIADFAFSPCPFCHGHETLLHVLRDCPRATSVWVHLVAPQHQRAFFFSSSLWDWILTHLHHPWSSVDSHDEDAVLFAAILWLLWKDRKSWVCDGRSFSSERVLHRVGTLAEDYGQVLQVEHSSPTTVVRYVSWCFYWNQPPSQLHLRSIAQSSNLLSPKL